VTASVREGEVSPPAESVVDNASPGNAYEDPRALTQPWKGTMEKR